ncbi:MAG: PIN domain-containing protein [Candidatus Aerophobetes bacterium]|nr:PIN domain-containing protein [Candidatus Aerophobetes bacterium]
MKSLYLDASIPSACCEKSEAERRKITLQWWKKEINHYRIVVSQLTVEEIKALKTEKKREDILSLISKFPILEITSLAERLANRYIQEKIFPQNSYNDALHLSLAVTNRIDIFLSWDRAHIVKKEVERKINAFNLISGYPRITIMSPDKFTR